MNRHSQKRNRPDFPEIDQYLANITGIPKQSELDLNTGYSHPFYGLFPPIDEVDQSAFILKFNDQRGATEDSINQFRIAFENNVVPDKGFRSLAQRAIYEYSRIS